MTFSSENNQRCQYIAKLKSIPILTNEEEVVLAKQWKDTQSPKAADKLVKAHLLLIAKVAQGYRGYGLPISDLIAEGNIGMMQAMKNFDPDKGFRLSTYAMFWIRSCMQDYILKNWSIVNISSTGTHKKLFFKLRKTQQEIRKTHSEDVLSKEVIHAIAEKLNVKPSEVEHMSQRFIKDSSLNATVNSTDGSPQEWIEWIIDEGDNAEVQAIQRDEIKKRRTLLQSAMSTLSVRHRDILNRRRLSDPPESLDQLATKYDISKERVRQIENDAFSLLQKYIRKQNAISPHQL